MGYFVIGEDGQKYGPADVPTLQGWVDEGRVLPNQQVEEEGSGIRMAASAISGLNFASQARPAAPQPPAPTYQPTVDISGRNPYAGSPGSQMMGDDGKNDLILAWVFGAIGAVTCCFLLEPIGLVFANRAMNKGNPGANAARIFNIVFLVISLFIVIAYFALVVFAISNGMVPKNPPSQPAFR